MRDATATALVSQYHPPRPAPAESAGPCMVVGCGGQLEVRHERQYGKVYVVCGSCEKRVHETLTLRAQLQRASREIAELRARPTVPTVPVRDRRELHPERNDEIVARYQAGETSAEIAPDYGITFNTVLDILERRGVPRRRGRPKKVAS